MGAKSSRNTTQNNRSDGHLLQYFRNTFVRGGGASTVPSGFGAPLGLSATGGVISDYTSGSTVYRAHIFTSTGTFSVNTIGSYPAIVDLLIVGGGAGAGGNNGGGGGRSSITH